MDVKQLSALADFDADKLKKQSVFQTSRFWLDVYCLKTGQAQKPHVHRQADKVYVILEGTCRFSIKGEVAAYGPGTAVLAPAGDEHGIENPGPGDARLLVLIAPPPA